MLLDYLYRILFESLLVLLNVGFLRYKYLITVNPEQWLELILLIITSH